MDLTDHNYQRATPQDLNQRHGSYDGMKNKKVKFNLDESLQSLMQGNDARINSHSRKNSNGKLINTGITTTSVPNTVKLSVNDKFKQSSITPKGGLPSKPPKPQLNINLKKLNNENNGQVGNEVLPAAKLASDYAEKLLRMQERLDKSIKQNVIVPNAVKVIKRKNNEEESLSTRLKREYEEKLKVKNKGIDLDLVPEKQKKDEDHDTYGYERSKRQVVLMFKDEMQEKLQDVKRQEMELRQKLNNSLIELDELNADKRIMSQQLLERIRFVRSLQQQLGTADNGEVAEMIDPELEEKFKVEKHLTIQLKQKIKECELERLQIAEHLKMLQAKREVTVVAQDDNHIELQKAEMNVTELINYRKQVIDNIKRVEQELYKQTQEENAVQQQKFDLERQLHIIQAEHGIQMQSFSHKEKATNSKSSYMENDKKELHYELKRHKNMLAGLVLENSISKSISRTIKLHYSEFLSRMIASDNQIQALIYMREACVNYELNIQKKYFTKWVKAKLKPMALVKINQKLTDVMLKREFKRKHLIEWNHQLLKKKMISNGQLQRIRQFFHNFMRIYERSNKYYFSLWKLKTKIHTISKKRLLRFIKERVYAKARQAFLNWQFYVTREDMMVRRNALVLKGSLKQYLTALFYGWRWAVFYLRKRKANRKVKAYNCLMKNVSHERFKKQIFSLYMMYKSEKHTLELAKFFNAFNIGQRMSRLVFVDSILENNIKIAIQTGKKLLDEEHTRLFNKRVGYRAKSIRDALGKRLFSYFAFWKEYAISHKNKVYDKAKVLMINTYNNFIRNYFNHWKDADSKKTKKKKMIMIQDVELQKEEIENTINQVKQQIRAEQVRSMNKGTKKVNNNIIFKVLYLKNVKARFQQWRVQIQNRDQKMSIIEKSVVVKLKRRYLRNAFNQFKHKTKLAQQIKAVDNKQEYVSFRIKYKATKRMFLAIKKFSRNHKVAKKCLNRTMETLDIERKKLAFRIWQRDHHAEKTEEQKQKLKMLEQEILLSNVESGELQSTSTKLKSQVVRSSNQRVSTGRKTIAKTIAQFGRYQQYSAFIKWREVISVQKDQYSKIKFSIIQRIKLRKVFDAFRTWRQVIKRENITRSKKLIQMEIQNQKVEEQTREQVKTKFRPGNEVNSIKIEQTQKEQAYTAKKCMNIIEKVISDKNDYFSIRIVENVFIHWRNFVVDKQKGVKRIAQLMDKNAQQVGFNAIRDINWDRKATNHKRDVLARFLKLFNYREKHIAWDRWRQYKFAKVSEISLVQQTKMNQKRSNDTYRMQKKQLGVVSSSEQTFRLKTLKKVIIALFDYKCLQKYTKYKNQEMQGKLNSVACRKLVLRWRQRTQVTIKSRRNVENYFQANRARLQMKIYKALKDNWMLKKLIVRRLKDAAESISKELVREAFLKIKVQAASIEDKRNWGYSRLERFVNIILSMRIEARYLKAFQKWKNSVKTKEIKSQVCKSVFSSLHIKRYRCYFLAWKKFTEKDKLFQEVTFFGSTSLEVRIQKQNVFNLKELLYDEGYTVKELTEMLDKSELNYRNKIEQSLCRLYLWNQRHKKMGLHLIPFCFNKIKQYARERKVFRYHMNRMNDYLELKDLQYLKRTAILKWYQWLFQPPRHLLNKQYLELHRMNSDQQAEKKELLEDMQNKMALIQEVKDQRQFLIGKVINAQRIALDRCNQSYKQAKEKAFTRLYLNSKREGRGKNNGRMKSNVNAIGDLKSYMETITEQNEKLAEEREELRKQAQNGADLMREAATLTDQVEQLTELLGQKARQIKEMIDKNKELQAQLKALGVQA